MYVIMWTDSSYNVVMHTLLSFAVTNLHNLYILPYAT